MTQNNSYDGNHLNGIIDLKDKGIVVKTVVPIMGLTGSIDKSRDIVAQTQAWGICP